MLCCGITPLPHLLALGHLQPEQGAAWEHKHQELFMLLFRELIHNPYKKLKTTQERCYIH